MLVEVEMNRWLRRVKKTSVRVGANCMRNRRHIHSSLQRFNIELTSSNTHMMDNASVIVEINISMVEPADS
jgi:hypothetical protein